jgi:hypothetical protein
MVLWVKPGFLFLPIAAFSYAGGLTPFVPVFQFGLMNGSEDIREISASALGDLAQNSSADALKTHIVKITGPLIRIVGDKFPAKVAVCFTVVV